MIVYSKRENFFEKEARRWTVEAEGLRSQIPGYPDAIIPWTAVIEIRLTFAPTRAKTWRHKLTVRSRSATWTIDNVHFKGVGNFEDRSEAFSAFVLACVEKVQDQAPDAVGRLGAAPLAYWAQVLFVGAMFSLLALVVISFPVNYSGLIWVKLGLIAIMLPVLFSFVVRSWPRRAPLDPEAFKAALP